MKIMLSELKAGEKAVIYSVNTELLMKQRLQDIGFIKGSEIHLVHSGPSGNPKAYFIKGSVIALRNCDAQKICVIKRGGERE